MQNKFSQVCTDWQRIWKSDIFYLNLHFKVHFEVGEQDKEDGKRQLEHFRHRGDPVFGERHTQVLFDGVHKHLMGSEHRSSSLQHWQQQLQGNHLRAQLMGPESEKWQQHETEHISK